MRGRDCALFLLVAALAAGCGYEKETTTEEKPAQADGAPAETTATPPAPSMQGHAMGMIQPLGDSKVTGAAHFTQTASGVELKLDLQNLPAGEHAVHIHVNGDCGDMGKAAGDHWNPSNEPHGKWGMPPHHMGDIGNVDGSSGTASITMNTDKWSMSDLVGKSVIVHASPDDFKTQPGGNAGARIACGIIENAGAM